MATSRSLPRPVLMGAFALSGAAALAYEVVWTRALSVVLGSTTYALSSMLATFMLGLAIGAIVGGRIADRGGSPYRWLGAAELGIGLLGLASHVVIDALPALYLAIYRSLHLSAGAFFTVQILLCCLVMLGPTVLMGMTFPLVTRAAGARPEDLGRVVGGAYGANTLGSVAGSLLAGFALIPLVGLRGSTLVAAGANLIVAAVVLIGSGVRPRPVVAAAVLLAYGALGAALASADRPLALVNFYSAHRFLGDEAYDQITSAGAATLHKVYEREGADGRVAAFRSNRSGHLVLQVGGKFEGTELEDVPNTLLLAYLPAAAHGDPKRMLVIGLGAGVTLEAARRAVPEVELAEISAGVLGAVAQHGPPGVLDGIRIHRDDARHLLLRTEERWDVISSEPSYPTEFAVANLFSREFYALAAGRLSDRGVFCQWLPYYMLSNDDVTMMVKTFGSVFPVSSLWRVEGSLDLLLIGSAKPFGRTPAEIVTEVTRLNGGAPLPFVLSRSPEQVAEIARRPDVPVNTDDRPRLEFRVARNFRVGQEGLDR